MTENFNPSPFPMYAAWRNNHRTGHGLVVGWVRDGTRPWDWHPVVAGAGLADAAPAATPSTYPSRELRKSALHAAQEKWGIARPVVTVELFRRRAGSAGAGR